MSSKKKKASMPRDVEIQGAKMLGKHVSREKGRVLLVATLLACALPMALGARLWPQIPEMVESGFVGASGQDDSIPRWMVAFGLPGLMCLLEIIAHFMLGINQKRMTIPPLPNRLVGRWGFPVISVLFCSGMILESTGAALSLPFLTPCILGLALLMLGAHMWDCPRDAKIALRFSFLENNQPLWKAVHRFAGWMWMIVGLIVIAGVMLTSGSNAATAVLILAAVLAPAGYGKSRAGKLN